MWHCCVSIRPGCFVSATVFLLGKRELWDTFWTAVFVGMTRWVSPQGRGRPGLRPGRVGGFRGHKKPGFLLTQE